MAFSPGGNILAYIVNVGEKINRIILREIDKEGPTNEIMLHSLSVNCLAFSPDGNMLAAGGSVSPRGKGQGFIKIWNTVLIR